MASTAKNFAQFAESLASTSPLRRYGAGPMDKKKKIMYVAVAMGVMLVVGGGIIYAMHKNKKKEHVYI